MLEASPQVHSVSVIYNMLVLLHRPIYCSTFQYGLVS